MRQSKFEGNSDSGPEKSHFVPRIINPTKISRAVICASDQALRSCDTLIQSEMPWVQTQVISNPSLLSTAKFNEPAAVILDDVAMSLVDIDSLRRTNPESVVVLLSFIALIQHAPPMIAAKEFPYTAKADLIFAVNATDFAPSRIISAVIRAAEDYLNIEKHPDIGRFIVLIVDDEPSWPSQFLPVLYRIIGQRAAIKITRTFEEVMSFMFGVEHESQLNRIGRDAGYGDQVICLITDIFFPKMGEITSSAGQELIALTNRYLPRIPIIIASKAAETIDLAGKGYILPKGDPGSLDTLGSYIQDRTGIGDFVIFDDSGSEAYRLRDICEIYQLLSKARGQKREAVRLRSLLEAYGEKDMFSTWFYMHSMPQLADRLRPQKHHGEKMVTVLAGSLKEEMQKMCRIPLVIDKQQVYNLDGLHHALNACSPEQLEEISHDDIISSWLDQKGFSELAENLRPIHGRGLELKEKVLAIISDWSAVYRKRDRETGIYSQCSNAGDVD